MSNKNNAWKTTKAIIQVLVTLSAFIGLALGIMNTCMQREVLRKHIDPEVEVFFTVGENWHDWQYFSAINKGPIDVVYFSVDYQAYGYDIGGREWTFAFASKKPFFEWGENWFYQERLKVNDDVSRKVSSTGPNIDKQDKHISAQVFDVTYYRESDMEKFERHVVFLVHNGEVYNAERALKSDVLRRPYLTLDDHIRRSNDSYYDPLSKMEKASERREQ